MIPNALSGIPFVERFYTYPTLPSTNDAAKELSQRPQKGLFCIQADRQSAGRGRRGASFFSDSTGGLWVSLLTKIPDPDDHFKYNRAISLAIVFTLEKLCENPPLAIKWPNDIYWGERKICGILLEKHLRYEDILVIGFGINVNMSREDFPEEIGRIATSVLIETGRSFSRSALLRNIIEQYVTIISCDPQRIHSLYMERLYGKGKTVSINGIKGVFSSVEQDGRMRLLADNGEVLITSGSPVFL